MHNLKYKLFYFAFLTLSHNLFSQQFITDTTYINLHKDTIKINARINQITDSRITNNVLKIGEKKKYYLFTIDHYYCTKNPLALEIKQSIICDTTSTLSFNINIDTIIIEPITKGYSKGTSLFTKLSINYSDSNSSYNSLGSLIQETIYKPKAFSGKKTEPYQEAFNLWEKKIAADLNFISSQISNNKIPDLYNLKNFDYKFITNLYTGAVFHLGLNGFLIDGEVYFSKPETSNKFKRNTSLLRYRQSSNFKSLEFNIMNENINFRLNSKYLAQFRSGLYFGLNNWEDIKENKHPIYDLFMLDFSASQLIMFNPLEKNSIIAGAGITESAYYIYTKNVKFDPYVTIYIGIKF